MGVTSVDVVKRARRSEWQRWPVDPDFVSECSGWDPFYLFTPRLFPDSGMDTPGTKAKRRVAEALDGFKAKRR